jgi:pimeloyl-ACP methyl ester carboxylesterase
VAFLGCASVGPASVPVATIAHARQPEKHASTLIVLLPGKRSHAGDFARNGFVDLARDHGVDADLVEVDLDLRYYKKGTASLRLWEDVVAPARASGYERIWIVGISLGGSGAIAFARDHAEALTGLVLLSPWLGPPEAGEKIRAAGGLTTWTPDSEAVAGFVEALVVANWAFLKEVSASAAAPALYLGFGTDEPMLPSFDVLAAALPDDRVVRVPGGHRWKTWRALWEKILSLPPACRPWP